MNMQLNGSHQATYEAIFRHPVARNLHWREVRSMLDELGVVAEGHSGSLKITRNGQTLALQRPQRSTLQVQEIMDIRRFLEQTTTSSPEPVQQGTHLLVVIDHREARIFRAELHGSIPQHITPYDPHGTGRHLHYVEDDSNGQRKPELRSFYDAVAKTLMGATEILVFGHGTGTSSAMNRLIAELTQHHRDIAKCVVGTISLDDQHLTNDQLLARAREFYMQHSSL